MPDTPEIRILLRTLAAHCIDDNISSAKIQYELGKLSEKDLSQDIDANMAFDFAVYSALDLNPSDE